MAFDLDKLSLKDTFTLQLRHPSTDALLFADEARTQPVEIVIYGTASEQYRKAVLAMSNARLSRGRKLLTAEGIDSDSIELLVACSDHGNNIQYQGNDLNSDSVFRALYSDPTKDWLKKQVDAALGEVANFLD